MNSLWQDIRFAARMLVRSPMFTVVAVLSLALGIGANTAIYSIVRAVLLSPLPVEKPEHLVVFSSGVISHPAYTDFRDRNNVLTGLAAYAPRELSMSRDGRPELVTGGIVTGNYFSVLGVQTVVGRAFLSEEDQPLSAQRVAVISHALWQRSFGGDSEVAGKTFVLNDQTFTVVGVAPQGFKGVRLSESLDLWIPVADLSQVMTGERARLNNQRSWDWLSAVGRLKKDVSIEQAGAELNIIASGLEQAYPTETPTKFNVALAPVATAATGVKARKEVVRFIAILFAVVGMALAIACANVANLLLARATGRRKEIAVRLALGASRARIIRQLLTESLLLSALGGAIGLLVALWAADVLAAYELPGRIAIRNLNLGLDSAMLGYTLLVSLVTGVLFGLIPALQASKPDLVSTIKDQGSSRTFARSGLRDAFLVLQIALCLVLLIGAGLFVKSLRTALAIDPGFETEKVALASVNLGLQRYTQARAGEFRRQVIERVERLPGVVSASWTNSPPVAPDFSRVESMSIEGYEPQASEKLQAEVNNVGVNYFQTIGVTFARGRDFDNRDREGAPLVAVINETFARRYWSDADPIGKSISFGKDQRTVIGVVKDSKYHSLSEDALPFVYLPLAQAGSAMLDSTTLLVHTAGVPGGVLASVRSEINSLDANLPLFNVKTMNEHLGDALMVQRFGSTLLGFFSLLTLALASVGIYGVVSYSVSQRTREIGVRMALGANRSAILKLMLWRGTLPVVVGIGVGLGTALILTRAVHSFLYGVSTTDAATFISAALLLGVVALVACYIPARRATKVDPMVALRHE
ncbi:MAG: ABC transporter permease [Pyrinomonadaceae bacterium]